MGVCLHMSISKSVTREEWKEVYEETLQLVEAFPLAEIQEVSVRGIETRCLVRTKERIERSSPYFSQPHGYWHTCGDYLSINSAEGYTLESVLVSDWERDTHTPDPDDLDALLDAHAPWLEELESTYGKPWESYCLWGNKTQGRPYHLYLLAIGCLIASRLGRKAYVYGDITRGQCQRAVRMANEHLSVPITVPDSCDLTRLFDRVGDLPLKGWEKIHVFEFLYRGRKDTSFGTFIRAHFPEEDFDEYCKWRLQDHRVTSIGFEGALRDCLTWGLDLRKLCSFVRYTEPDGTDYYADFVKSLMGTKVYLHHEDKDAVIGIDPDGEEPYGLNEQITQLFLPATLYGSDNRYIPLKDIRSVLADTIGDVCPTDDLVKECLMDMYRPYLSRHANDVTDGESSQESENDFASAIEELFDERARYGKELERYDIVDLEDLPLFKAGDTILPDLAESVAKAFAEYDSIGGMDDEAYRELMELTPDERCRWLVNAHERQALFLRDIDWEKILDDITEHPASFKRYYPMTRLDVSCWGARAMIAPFLVNDDLYAYAAELAHAIEA